MMPSGLPFEIHQAVVNVCGRCFWLKDPLRAFLLRCGVPAKIYDRFAEEPKFKIARHVLAELEGMGDDGITIQRRIVTELARLRKVPDDTVPNRSDALDALREFKELCSAHGMSVAEEQARTNTRTVDAKHRQAALEERAKKMGELRARYMEMVTSSEDPQGRGYALEDLLADLFAINEMTYRRAYKLGTEQIDGHFAYKGFDYLVEARWRKTQPVETDLNGLKAKADKKITSTRGLFLSIAGFRREVVDGFAKGTASNLILMDGADLALILEGRISLTDALELKVQKAAQEGVIFYALSGQF